MEVQFSPDMEARLAEYAAQQCKSPDEAVRDVVARYFQEEDRFMTAVKRGEAALASGEILSHEQVPSALSEHSLVGTRSRSNVRYLKFRIHLGTCDLLVL